MKRIVFLCCVIACLSVGVTRIALGAAVKGLFENTRVRVYEVTIPAHETEAGMHRHKVPYVYYILEGGKAVVRAENGTSQSVEYKTGEVLWGEVESHGVDNVGDTNIRVLIVEIK